MVGKKLNERTEDEQGDTNTRGMRSAFVTLLFDFPPSAIAELNHSYTTLIRPFGRLLSRLAYARRPGLTLLAGRNKTFGRADR